MVHLTLPTFAIVSALGSLALLSSTVEAHQILRDPMPPCLATYKGNTMDPVAFLETQNITTGSSFKKWRIENKYKTLRAFMIDKERYNVVPGATFDCGWTDINGTAQPIPKNGGMRTSGYTHYGACEVWLDKKRVAQGDNCHNDFADKKHCIDYSSCKGTCVLYWYWLGERFVKNKHSWQVYKACVPLTTGGKTVEPPTCKQIGAAPSSYASN